MIQRYARDEMMAIWTDENKFKAYLEVEILAVEAWSKLGVVPEADAVTIRDRATFSLPRIYEIEQVTQHDVVAFTRAVSESLGAEKKWIHYGLTSTDVVDTANGYLLKQANSILQRGIDQLLSVLKAKALQYKDTLCMGRTHGMHADLTSFGLKWALWYAAMQRNRERLLVASRDIEAGKMSGAVGNFVHIPPFVQDYVCEKLGIQSSTISTQVLQRDRHAHYLSVLALIGTTMEQIATEVRHLQRTEVGEVEEDFSYGQKGSSAMPHKRNPISSENICGCARVLRGYMLSGYENVALWHERDISHSSAERIILPDATLLLDYMLYRYTRVLEHLRIFPDKMKDNINQTNKLVFAQNVMTFLIDKGMSREEAYDLVQSLAMRAREEGNDFQVLVTEEPTLCARLDATELATCFSGMDILKNVALIFQRVGIID